MSRDDRTSNGSRPGHPPCMSTSPHFHNVEKYIKNSHTYASRLKVVGATYKTNENGNESKLRFGNTCCPCPGGNTLSFPGRGLGDDVIAELRCGFCVYRPHFTARRHSHTMSEFPLDEHSSHQRRGARRLECRKACPNSPSGESNGWRSAPPCG